MPWTSVGEGGSYGPPALVPADSQVKASATSFEVASRLGGCVVTPGAPSGLGWAIFPPAMPPDGPVILVCGAAGLFAWNLGHLEGCYSGAGLLSPRPSPGSLARYYWSGTWRWWYHRCWEDPGLPCVRRPRGALPPLGAPALERPPSWWIPLLGALAPASFGPLRLLLS